MIRKSSELELVESHFEHYTAVVQKCISETVAAHRCLDTSDVVLNQLWKRCRNEIISIIIDIYDDTDMKGLRHSEHPLPDRFREGIRDYLERSLAFEAEIGDLDDDAFEEVYREYFVPIVNADRKRRVETARERDRWAFFNKPNAEVDLDLWRDKLLTPAQAVALSLGKSPDLVNPKTLQPYQRVASSPFREYFKETLDRVEYAIARDQLPACFLWADFTIWALKNNLPLLSSRLNALEPASVSDASLWKAKFEAAQDEIITLRKELESPSTARKRTFFRMILAMAVGQYGHRTDSRSKAANNIRIACEKVELSVQNDTIHDCLVEAARDLNFEWPKTRR